MISPETISHNLTSTISDHLPQFMIVTNVYCDPPSNKSIFLEKDWSNFDQKNLYLNFFLFTGMKLLKLTNKMLIIKVFLTRLAYFQTKGQMTSCLINFPCKFWEKYVNKNDQAIHCDLCQ